MLFGYAIAATQNNWLHDCICAAVRTIHAAIDQNKKYPGWPAVLPRAYHAVLKSRTGLRDRLKAYKDAVRKLDKKERDLLLEALEGENRVSDLLSGTCERVRGDRLPQPVLDVAADLFGFAYDELLTELDVRDQHYAAIYKRLPARVCPFCGVYPLSGPGGPREALDHYLARSIYPFAAANLRNLVPMCHACNSGNKLSVDICYDVAGRRRKAFDPYGDIATGVDLTRSVPFQGRNNHLPKWIVTFTPDSEEAQTWDAVFHVRERHQRDVLDAEFDSWLRDFKAWCRSANVSAVDENDVPPILERYRDLLKEGGLRDRAFLKAAVFEMLLHHCRQNDDRLLQLLLDLVQSARPAAKTMVPAHEASAA